MEILDIIKILLMSLSFLLVILLICLQLWLPNRFLKHPGQLFFYSCIFQLLDHLKHFTYILALNHNYTSDSPSCQAIAWISSFASFMQLNYILFLSVEIIIKLNNNADNKYKIRCKIYHIFSLISSTSVAVVIYELGSYGIDGNNICSVVENSLGESIILIYVFSVIPVMWAAIFWTLYKMRRSKKRMAFSLAMVVFCITIGWIIGNFIPKLLLLIHKNNEFTKQLSQFVIFTLGSFTSLARIMNKKLKEDIREKYIMYKLKKNKVNLRGKIKSKELNRLLSDLIEDDESMSIVINDFSGSLFDNITKKVPPI